MKIFAPINNIDELDGLISAGADEFYGGFIPDDWFEKYGVEGSPNCRNFLSAQIKSEKEFLQIVEKSHSHNKPFYLTLNQKLFSAKQYSFVDDFVKYLEDICVDGLIVSDLGFILFLKKSGCNIPVVLSTLAQVTNSKSAEFYSELGIKRIVFPRDLSLKEIEKIVKDNPSVEFEVLVVIGKCFNLEGFCTYEHCNQNRVWPCNQEYKITFNEKNSMESDVARQIKVFGQTRRSDACGLCALACLKRIGVKGLKAVGRGANYGWKKKSVESIKFLLDRLENETTDARKQYEYIFGHSCERVNCYFPELTV